MITHLGSRVEYDLFLADEVIFTFYELLRCISKPVQPALEITCI